MKYILKDSHSVNGKSLPKGSEVELTEKQARSFADKIAPLPSGEVDAPPPADDEADTPAPKGKAGKPPAKP